jgi:hypothetical protein
MENLTLKVESANGEITIREGQALELQQPEKINLTGDINTVKSFIEKRKGADLITGKLQYINPSTAVVIVDKAAYSLTLKLDPENVYGTEVTAKLEIEPELLKFQIETGKKFTQQELIKLLKYGKRWFYDDQAHAELLLAYMKLDVRVTADLKNDAPDNKGNRFNSFEKKVTSNIPNDFIMSIPLFKGQEPKRFRVEIAMDSTDGSVKFWLESVEMAELIDIESERLLKLQATHCADYVVIWK